MGVKVEPQGPVAKVELALVWAKAEQAQAAKVAKRAPELTPAQAVVRVRAVTLALAARSSTSLKPMTMETTKPLAVAAMRIAPVQTEHSSPFSACSRSFVDAGPENPNAPEILSTH